MAKMQDRYHDLGLNAKPSEPLIKASRSQSIWAQSAMTGQVTLYLWVGLDVHPIYWSDALAVDEMAGELRNWLHRSICKLMSL